MDKQHKKKRRRGPYRKNTLEAEDESELTLSVDSSDANLKEEPYEVLEVLKQQASSSSSLNKLRETVHVSINWTCVFFKYLYCNNKQFNYNFGLRLINASEDILII